MATSAVDIAVVMFQSLAEDEQEDLYQRLTELRARRPAGEHSETERIVISLRLVADHLGGSPSPTDYKLAYRELRAGGAEVQEFNRVVRHFGSWRLAKEALALSETTTVRRIEARFRFRKMGKVWRYTDEMLRETLERCVEHYGRPPMVAEFEWWRTRELELATAQGNPYLHLPSATPYRKRWGCWEGALLHFGYTPEQVAERLERA